MRFMRQRHSRAWTASFHNSSESKEKRIFCGDSPRHWGLLGHLLHPIGLLLETLIVEEERRADIDRLLPPPVQGEDEVSKE